VAPALSTARYVLPGAPDPHTGLVHSPAGTYRLLARLKFLLQQRDILEHPTMECSVINLDAVLFYDLFKLTVADGIRHILTDRPQDHVPFNVECCRRGIEIHLVNRIIYLTQSVIVTPPGRDSGK
jgi:hypothetical protein